ncbi:nuclear receptor-binding protein isoform X11 [Octopus bimaculoides]|uniref:nuclear receptor-binding protein isoform X11 n=1 Tax=Octopus bimaculoides TaxID=37653 RepID=UPI00071C22E2|nr:nuclear receptor-binding protein isoform X11 [Octopus bimaculoides]|eukprot:XP_014780136.1 PREDICTED: nuclear receptor-binding protein-like isoform X9 [Octopus bimaculoides]
MMAETEAENRPDLKTDSGDESDDLSEVLEESPCGRWQKRREEVEQRDVPGIDSAFLAMDTEEGMEVVWNEVQFSEKKNFKAQQEKIRQVFDNLIQLDHPNIVKFHKYWTDTVGEKPRVIFITEYMSSGSLKQFLKKTKKNNKTFPLKGHSKKKQAWKRWCTQILSALSYLHSCDPPIIHGNLTCDTIFIQHNGLVKIGSDTGILYPLSSETVAPDAIHHHVKTYREDLKNMHCIAPEYEGPGQVTTAVDIYSFGMCALEMAALEIQGNGEANVTPEAIKCTLESLEDSLQRDFIRRCIERDPQKRPGSRELLFHAVLFEVHSLKLLAGNCFVKNSYILPGNMAEEAYLPKTDPSKVIAEINFKEHGFMQWKFSQVGSIELEKFLEDVRNGIYPLTAFALPRPPPSRPRAITPELAESVKSETPEPMDVETRMVTNMACQMRKPDENCNLNLTLLLRMDDKMNRQLQCEISQEDNASTLAEELVHYGFINELDKDKVATLIEQHLRQGSTHMNGPMSPITVPSG